MKKQTYYNPIISGYYPDPSIVRVGKDYYLCTSTFEFFPGVPLFHSNNLVNWNQIGHCLTRESQLPLQGAPPSTGILAPTIRYHKGEFYMITTNMTELIKRGVGNFIVKSTKPDGEWSEPIWIEHEGIDPSLYFEDDKAYYCGTGFTEKGQAIILFEIDPNTGEVLSEKKDISYGASGKCPEAPHIYKINDWYYLLLAEGGTEYGHMVTIQRSKNIWGPYESCPNNPILTHRNFNGGEIQCVGHADLFEDHNGNWWMVCLGIRPIGPMLHQLGRETFLVPVEWKNGWPYPSVDKMTLKMEGPIPEEQQERSTDFFADFDEDILPFEFNYIRTPDMENYSIDKENSRIILKGDNNGLSGGLHSPTFIGIRQKDFNSVVTVSVDLDMEDGTVAGLTAYYMDTHHYDIRVRAVENKFYVELNKRIYDLEGSVSKEFIEADKVELRIESTRDKYIFSYSIDGENFIVIGEGLAAGLSTEITEVMTFTGTYLGIFAQNGVAKFDKFEYHWKEEALNKDNKEFSMYPDGK